MSDRGAPEDVFLHPEPTSRRSPVLTPPAAPSDTALPTWAVAVGVIAVLRGLAALLIPVLPEEAYHWTYARHLDIGYYDHPPLIAWMIWAGRTLLGDTAAGIRLLPWLASIGTSIAAARTARRLYGEAAAAWTAILLGLQPATFLGSSFGVPDSGLLLFWALGMAFAVEALLTRRGAWWLAAGAALGAALLSKYTAACLAGSLFLYLLVTPRDRFWLKTPWPYLGLLVAALVFSPVVVWNATHHWASFRFQSVGRLEESRGFRLYGGPAYLFLQIGSVVPLTAPLVFVALTAAGRERTPEDRLLLCLSLPMLAFFLAVGFVRSTHVFWPLPGWIGLTILCGGTLARNGGRIAGLYREHWRTLTAISIVALGVGMAHAVRPLLGISPLRSVYHWDEIARRASALRSPLPEGSFYLGVGRRYLCAAQLAFHLNAPDQVHAKNLLGEDGLQFTYWADSETLRGKDAVVVAEADWSPRLLEILKERFRQVEEVPEPVVVLRPEHPRGLKEESYHFYIGHGYRPLPTP
jgi:dolichol-phosphate mannosyltransferase